jgi:glucosamine 6-phosphate synthetase-like amidotransferase/phosphosugar isomerase protein
LVVAVSQSGEMKDLIDVVNHVIAQGLPILGIAIVLVDLAQEKCDTVLPLPAVLRLRCRRRRASGR